MERKIVRGKTTKQQMDSIDHALLSFTRKMKPDLRVMLPPVPVFALCRVPDPDGLVATILSPFDCLITKAYISVGRLDVKEFNLTVELNTGRNSSRVVVRIEGQQAEADLEWALDKNSCIRCYVNEQTRMSEVAMAFLTYPNPIYYRHLRLEKDGKKE